MADDIVSFGMEIDSSAARKAKEDLNNLAKSGPAVEQALRRVDAAGTSGAAGMNAVSTAARRVDREFQSMHRSVLGWSRALQAVFAGFTVMSVIDAADSWGQYASRMKMATQSTEEYQHAQERMAQSAATTFRSIEETRESFIQLSPILREMGYTLDQSIDAVDAFSGLLVVAGANAERGANAMNALAKALQKGKVDADAWMTIYSTADNVVEHLAASTNKSAAEIRALGAAGKISGDMMARALVEGYEPIIRAVEGMPTTVRDAFTNLNTQFIEYVGKANEANGATQVLVSGINALSDNFGTVANGIVTAGGALAIVMGARMVAAAGGSAIAFATLAAQAGRARVAVAGMSSVGVTATVSFNRMAVAARLASGALSLIGGPIGAIVIALGGAAYAWREFGTSARDSADASVRSLTEVKGSIEDLIKSYQKLNTLQREQVINIKTEDLSTAVKEVSASVADLGNAFTPALTQGTRAAAQFRADFSAEIKAVASATEMSSDDMASALSGVIDGYIRSGRASEENRSKLTDLAQKVVEAAGNVNGLTKELEALAKAQSDVASGVAPVADRLAEYRKNYEQFMKDFATPQEKFRAAIAETKELLGEFYSDEVERRLRDRHLPKSRSSSDAELRTLMKSLELQSAVLGMTEAAAGRYRIEIAKGTEADRARALALYDQIEAWKEADKAIKQAAESSRYIAAINRELEVFQQQQGVEIAGIGMGDRQREQLERELAVRQDYAERRRQLEETQAVESTRLNEDQYRTRIEALEYAEKEQIRIIQESAQAKLASEGDWINGAMRGLQNYADEVNNVAESIGNAVSGAFKGMEDALTEFVTTGKLDFKSLADSIIKDMVRIAIQQSITGPLAGALVGMLGGGVQGLSMASSIQQGGGDGIGALIAMNRWSSGGYTGDGGRFEPAGIVHRGEGVLNQDEIRALGGPTGFEHLRRALRGPGHAVGGMAGSPSLPDLAGSKAPNVKVEVINRGAPVQATPGDMRWDGKQWVLSVILEDMRSNGPFTQQLAAMR